MRGLESGLVVFYGPFNSRLQPCANWDSPVISSAIGHCGIFSLIISRDSKSNLQSFFKVKPLESASSRWFPQIYLQFPIAIPTTQQRAAAFFVTEGSVDLLNLFFLGLQRDACVHAIQLFYLTQRQRLVIQQQRFIRQFNP